MTWIDPASTDTLLDRGFLNEGQQESVRFVAERLKQNGVIIADEVGMGKTRIVTTICRAVVENGGRVAILIPPGVGYQWKSELAHTGLPNVRHLRSLWQYLEAWSTDGEEPPAPWFGDDCLLISHGFTNWRIGTRAQKWRTELLPAVAGYWRKSETGRFPRGYRDLLTTDIDPWVREAAEAIVNHFAQADTQSNVAIERLKNIAAEWSGELFDSNNYQRLADEDETYRDELENAVGLGLGEFDLVVIDEAHKNRGADSMLSSLLRHVVVQTEQCRRIGMTATPVELQPEQWLNILNRVGVEFSEQALSNIILEYIRSVEQLRWSPRHKDARRRFREKARHFFEALRPYLVRRTKQEEPLLQDFQKHSGLALSQYRKIEPVRINPAEIPPVWQRALCGVEGLSLTSRHLPVRDSRQIRARLSFQSGQSLSALLDREIESDDTHRSDGQPFPETSDSPEIDVSLRLRHALWDRLVYQALGGTYKNSIDLLYDHPAILKIVETVEAYTRQGEKVLVFGRFTRPIKALARLIDARALVRTLQAGESWPQEKLLEKSPTNDPKESQYHAVCVALRQLAPSGFDSVESIQSCLKEQYHAHQKQIQNFRKQLIERLTESADAFPSLLVRQFINHLLSNRDKDEQRRDINALSDALFGLMGSHLFTAATDELLVSIRNLVHSLVELDQPDLANVQDEMVSDIIGQAWEQLRDQFRERRPHHARFMTGETPPAQRHTIQNAFNQRYSPLRVLVVQSQVGSEGLNLHEACRIVVLQHLEWNPAVVEQQIGRVDRVNSLWERMVRQKLENPEQGSDEDEWPRIIIRPVIFSGTYDEYHWRILEKRWRDLRAQLHGDVLGDFMSSDGKSEAEQLDPDILEEIRTATPDFSPAKNQG